MKFPLPTLSTEGIITSPERAVLYLFKSFLAIDKNVSNYWRSDVESFMYLKQKYGNNIEGLSNATQEALEKIYSVYFDKVNVRVDFKSGDSLPLEETNVIDLEIALTVEDGNSIIPLTTVLHNAFLDDDDVFNRLIFKRDY